MTYSAAFESGNPMAPQGDMPVQQMIIGEVDVKPAASVDELISQLVSLSSYLNQLYTQSHLIHLNLEGPLFIPVHEFLKEQYAAHIEQFDAIAEFVRTMDYLMPMCDRGLASAYKGFKHVKSYDTREMLTVYTKNLEACGMMAKDVGCMAKEVGAPDVENYAAELVGMMFKGAWFLKATLRNGSETPLSKSPAS
jgi:DNA-binding ferritin-like protein